MEMRSNGWVLDERLKSLSDMIVWEGLYTLSIFERLGGCHFQVRYLYNKFSNQLLNLRTSSSTCISADIY